MVSHVLGKFAPDERPLLQEALARAAAATLMTLSHGFDAAANQFNIKKEKKKKEKPAPTEPIEPAEQASSAEATE